MQIKFVMTSEALADGIPCTEITFIERNSRTEITEILGKLLPEATLLDAGHLSAVQSYGFYIRLPRIDGRAKAIRWRTASMYTIYVLPLYQLYSRNQRVLCQ